MLEWLVLIGLIVVVVRLANRVTLAERQLAELAGHSSAFTYAPESERPEAEPVEVEPLPELAAGPWQPASVSEPEDVADFPATSIEPDSLEEESSGRRFSFSFEELFGRRLPIWAGGITLAIAGMLIVKLSIEAGLLSPSVRVITGLIFGAALIGGAEAALRNEHRVRDARVRQALSGAGIASLYASILIAANLYGLIPPLLAMAGAAAVTAVAMGLAIRFGPPSALLGLAGGLAAPALIGSAEPNVPLLTLYLALAIGGLATLSRSQRWAWLGISALVGGFGWGLVLLVTGALDAPGSISLGLFILLLGVGLPALRLAGDRNDQLQLLAGIAAAAQMAALVAMGGFSLLNWGLFGLIAMAAVWLSNREPALERLAAVSLAIALLLMAAWPDPSWREFALVLGGAAFIHGIMPLRRLWTEHGGLLDAAQLAALALGGWLLPMFRLHRGDGSNDVVLGLLAAGLAAAAAGIAALGWTNTRRRDDARFTVVAVSAALLAAAAASLLLPHWSVGIAIGATGLALLHLGQAAEDSRLEPFAWTFAAGGLVAFFLTDASFGNSTAVDTVRFALLTGVAALFAWCGGYDSGRTIAQFLAPVLLYGALAPLLDLRAEPLIAPLTLVGLAWAAQRLRKERLLPALASAALIVLLWAARPLLEWSDGGFASLIAEPMLLDSVPAPWPVVRQLLIPGLLMAISVFLVRERVPTLVRQTGLIVTATLGAVAVHSLYKQVFAIDGLDEFVALGFAERTVWEFLLVVAAAVAMRLGRQGVAVALAAAAAAHFALYTLLLHNPLWSAQQVGPWPILNLLLPAYGLALVLTWAASRLPARRPEADRAISAAQMLLIALFAFSTLRQLFHGSILAVPGVGQAEDILRSILAIALAIGFLLWGIARDKRDWRIASLVLMLGAVAKVFLFDASGLEGLTRIASFVALGFSLIGIGWLYARHLPASGKTAAV